MSEPNNLGEVFDELRREVDEKFKAGKIDHKCSFLLSHIKLKIQDILKREITRLNLEKKKIKARSGRKFDPISKLEYHVTMSEEDEIEIVACRTIRDYIKEELGEGLI